MKNIRTQKEIKDKYSMKTIPCTKNSYKILLIELGIDKIGGKNV